MHDGYIFTLGVCGSASDSSPAPACLNAMLAALPPVKRAAYLGEVLLNEGAPSLADPLTGLLLGDVADAEVLLIVTPLPGGALPSRVHNLAQAIAASAPAGGSQDEAQPPRFAALVAIGDGQGEAFHALRVALARVGATIVGEIHAPADAEQAQLVERAVELARAAYALARERRPAALPQ
jgi:hypothetical protein